MEAQKNQEAKRRPSFREVFQLGEVGSYFFRKKDPNRPSNINIKMMHGINKLSIIVFVVAVLYLVLRHLF